RRQRTVDNTLGLGFVELGYQAKIAERVIARARGGRDEGVQRQMPE
ncbi:MAG: hypothetical protein IPI67_19660, partial [Myxococcales bacterium]|nr:hypothetical protein [Myxococcales bacterium]